MNDSPWPTVWEFAVGCMLVAFAALGLMIALSGCAGAPPRTVAVPHICAPGGDSVGYQKCSADCPEGDAFVIENSKDVACYCRKPHEM